MTSDEIKKEDEGRTNFELVLALAAALKVDPKVFATAMADKKGMAEYSRKFTAEFAHQVVDNLTK